PKERRWGRVAASAALLSECRSVTATRDMAGANVSQGSDRLGEWVETSSGGASTSPTGRLEDIEPGPFLAWRLAGIDRRELNGNQLVELMQARSRLVSHLQAELLADVAELAHTPPGVAGSPPERTGGVDEFVSDEVAAALTLTSRSADSLVKLALDLERLPQVLAALQAG